MNATCRLVFVLGSLLCASGVQAASSAVASVSDSVATSVGSLSRSVKQSSDSSSKTVVGQGMYEVIQVAGADADGLHDVTLQALPGQAAATGVLTLRLPAAALAQGDLAPGRQVQALQRAWGWELLRADTRTAFFQLLADDWARELDPVPVGT